MGIKILKPGVLTTVQDLGRIGYQKHGVIVSGAMDQLATKIVNMLVGNQETKSVLEMTMKGAKIEFQTDTLIAIGGGDMAPSIDGEPVPAYRPVLVQKGSVLSFGMVKKGCRTYLAVAGGLDLPIVMGSHSTYMRAGIGGLKGRPLRRDDTLTFGPLSVRNETMKARIRKEENFGETNWGISSNLSPRLSENPVIVRAFRGRQDDWFTQKSMDAFFTESFRVSSESDRMGYRLRGPELTFKDDQDLLSEAVTNGTVQITSDGNPIILMSDRQTTGGYAKIAQIATVDLPVLAQLKPGDDITFKEISHDEAQIQLVKREKELCTLKQGLTIKMRKGE